MSQEQYSSENDSFAPFRIPVYRRFWIGNLLLLTGVQMQLAAVLWEIFVRTNDNFDVGIASLIQFLPVLFLSIPAGFLADRFPRPQIVRLAMLGIVAGSLLLACASYWELPIAWLYAGLLVNGCSRAAQQPAKASLLPEIVPRELFPSAVAWNSGAFQLACVLGPMLAALIIAFYSAAVVYVIEAGTAIAFLVALIGLRERADRVRIADAISWEGLSAGFRFLWQSKIILAAITLDLFAVLLGGATALLPVYSDKILPIREELDWVAGFGAYFGFSEIDPNKIGYGLLRTAPALGAVGMSLWLVLRPPLTKAGRALMWSVAGFGVATIVFGISRSFWLSMLMLIVTGALDTISVVVRHTVIQLRTPDEMRGRVQAINGVFIGASNELGGFESGLVASLYEKDHDPSYGPTVSVVSGGIGTILIVLLTSWLSPGLRKYGDLRSK